MGRECDPAVGFPRDDPYTVERAGQLLEQKLSGVIASNANVSEEDAWGASDTSCHRHGTEHLSLLKPHLLSWMMRLEQYARLGDGFRW